MIHPQPKEVLLLRDSSQAFRTLGPTAIAIGSFDGLHRGHRALLRRLVSVACAQRVTPLLLSFYPHPAQVLRGAGYRPPLLSLRQRLGILREIGVQAVVMARFTKALSQIEAEPFIRQFLIDKLKMGSLVVGPDAALGRGRAAGIDEIGEIVTRLGCDLQVVPHLLNDGTKIGSRSIRSIVEAGFVKAIPALMEMPYTLDGRIVRGDGRGKKISFATANIATKQLLPALGVYAGSLVIDGIRNRAVVNIGNRPTFTGRGVTIEAHLYDYSGNDFYGKRVELELSDRLRDEQRFESVELLKRQIECDILEAKKRSIDE